MADVIAQVTVTMTADGKVNVNGPMENKILCYGLLEMAKEVIVAFNAAQEKRVQLAPPGSAQFLKSAEGALAPGSRT
jgi:hypothetical protein